MNASPVLVVSDEVEFIREFVSRWEMERDAPPITVVSTEMWKQASLIGYALVIVGFQRQNSPAVHAPEFHGGTNDHCDTTVCVVGDPARLSAIRSAHPEWLTFLEQLGWPDTLLSFAKEILRRVAAEKQARESENTCLSQQRLATVGQSLLEAKPGMVNALTSLLGNADLLLLSDERLSAGCLEQIRTIHTMALRLNEILQRLSSLANEMELSESESQRETREIHDAAVMRGLASD
jgi:hypothetical protein